MRDQSPVVALCSSLKKKTKSHFQNVNWSNAFWLIPRRPEGVLAVLVPWPCPGLWWEETNVCYALEDGSSLTSCALAQAMVTLPPSPCV